MVATTSPQTPAENPLSEILIEKIGQLSPSQKTIWDKIAERVAQLPPEVIEQLPTDSSENLDHYLYGAPKK